MKSLTALLALLAACYEPEAVDCTVTCSGVGDCAEGQICGSDGLCAAPELAGHCMASEIDEPQMVTLAIAIEGDGKVTVGEIGTCDDEDGVCMFTVRAGLAYQLKAVEKDDREFISWTQSCSGTDATCSVVPVTALTQVGAKFQ